MTMNKEYLDLIKHTKNKIIQAKLEEKASDEQTVSLICNLENSADFKLLLKDARDFYLYLILIHLDNIDESSEKNLLSQYLSSQGFKDEEAQRITNYLYPYLLDNATNFIRKSSDNSIPISFFKIISSNEDLQNYHPSDTNYDFENNLYLSCRDIERLSLYIQEDKDKYSSEIFKLMISFTAFARANPHPNGWIKYDQKSKDIIFFLASCAKKDQKSKEWLTSTLHLRYNLNMRVVGSTQPIPCFQLAWQTQPLLDPDFLICIGAKTPLTIDELYEFLCNTTLFKKEN